jgi:nitric oxide reductase NorE protein
MTLERPLSGTAGPAITSPARTSASPTERAPRQRHVPGEAGLWVLLFGDMGVFALLFGIYLAHRGQQPDLFARSQNTLNRNFGALNTLLLLTSSLLVALATRAVRQEPRRDASRLMTGAFVGGLGFVVVKAFEYHDKYAAGVTPNTNKFYMYYFVLTGLHLAHLAVGLVVLSILWRLSRKPALSGGQFMFFEGGACFWHMVDLLWIMIFPLLYLAR